MLRQGEYLNGTYRLLEEIGSGGGGIVYKAYHERLQSYVVVKRMKEQVKGLLDGRAEVDVLKNLKHTYLPRVYDFLQIGGEIYTVMDFIPGQSLDKVLKQNRRIPRELLLRWMTQLAEALAYLHSQTPPVIHSDIKPSNIMVTPEENICLIDFNISLVFDHSIRTSSGISGGYSPPEQYPDFPTYQRLARPEGRQEDPGTASATDGIVAQIVGRGVDGSSDIYSLGASFYHLATGIRPGRDFDRIVPIDRCGTDLGEGLITILKKSMELRPEARYQDGGQLLYALQHIHELDSEYQRKQRRRKRRKLCLAVLFLSLVLALGGGFFLWQKEKDRTYNRMVEQAREYIEGRDYDRALALLKEAVGLRPKRIDAYECETLRLYRQGDHEACIRYGRDVLQNVSYRVGSESDKQKLGNIYYLLGNSYLEEEDPPDAEISLKTAIGQYGGNSLYYRDYAVALAKQGKSDEAESMLERAGELGLGEDSIYMVQGEIACAEGSYEEAKGYLSQAIAASTDDSLRKRAVLLGDRVYRELGAAWLDEEIAFLEQEENRAGGAASSMEITERLADAYVRKAGSEEGRKDEYHKKALERFELLYENGYAARQTMENIAILREQTGDHEGTKDMLFEMTEQYPEDYRGYKRLAFLEADIQQTKDNADRDYQLFAEYYQKAQELYEGRETDQEMEMLAVMLQDLKDGNWL